jgi:hypothetical protein
MLARSFKTAAELQITDSEYEAALVVLRMLERGELHHLFEDEQSHFNAWDRATIPNGFNMACSGVRTSCGTVACIGGWMAMHMKLHMRRYVGYTHSPSLRSLFWGNTHSHTTTEQAAMAMRNFLTVGKPEWASTCGDKTSI